MMGTSHAISGAAAWVAITATEIPSLGLYAQDAPVIAGGALVVAGAALLPDADHHNATIAHSIPVAGSLAAGAVGALSGGHRKGMHSLLAVVGVIFGMFWLGQLTWVPDGWDSAFQLGNAIAVAATVTFATKVLKIARAWPIAWLMGLAAGALAGFLTPDQSNWLPWAIGTGYLVHIAGDMLTSGGVPLAWPLMIKPPKSLRKVPIISNIWLPHGAIAVPVLGDTGSWRERVFSMGLAAYAVWGVAASTTVWLQTVF